MDKFDFAVVGNNCTLTFTVEDLTASGRTSLDFTKAEQICVYVGYLKCPKVLLESTDVSVLTDDTSSLKVTIPGNHPTFQHGGIVGAEITFNYPNSEGTMCPKRFDVQKVVTYYEHTEDVEALLESEAEFNGDIITVKNAVTLGEYTFTVNKLTLDIGDGDLVTTATDESTITDKDAKVYSAKKVDNKLAELSSKKILPIPMEIQLQIAIQLPMP